jgi:hypothetical protein
MSNVLRDGQLFGAEVKSRDEKSGTSIITRDLICMS